MRQKWKQKRDQRRRNKNKISTMDEIEGVIRGLLMGMSTMP